MNDMDGVIDSQDKAPTGNRLLEIRIGEIEVELYKKYVWRYLFGESWGSDRWMEDTLFCVIIDTKYNAFILPYLYGKGKTNYQKQPRNTGILRRHTGQRGVNHNKNSTIHKERLHNILDMVAQSTGKESRTLKQMGHARGEEGC